MKKTDTMKTIDKVIHQLFTTRWSGDLSNGSIEDMRAQLYKSLNDQINGLWSGHTAYHIMIDGGFLIDAKHSESKKLTAFGKLFMKEQETA